MGSNDQLDSPWLKASPQDKVTLPAYYIARYPVAVAQFHAFTNASGYQWGVSSWEQGAVNHPIVYVSWYDSLAYCNWLTARLREWSGTPEPLATLLRTEDWRVILPSEAEWEKAACGADGRAYSCGNEPDPNRANYNETGVNTTSAVGCFPYGASPYGVEELSGNVWEWTRSLVGDYPYPAKRAARAKREDLQASAEEPRVLRGGTFWDDRQSVRCAVRSRPGVRDVYNIVGFRVALAGPP
jgi:formylglycine-generating enzyme required for sulfatase activity